MHTKVTTDESNEAKSPTNRRCKLVFDITNKGGGHNATVGINFARAKVKAKGGVWVKMPKVKTTSTKSGRWRAGEKRRITGTVHFREPCKRKRRFTIPVCFKKRGWSVPAKCTTVGAFTSKGKKHYKSGPYGFKLEVRNVRHGQWIDEK